MTVSLQFLGAAGTVTGSKFLLTHDGGRVLIDCGMYQGLKELRERNWAAFPVNGADLDAVVLTHAHLDHSGALPLLCRSGFGGPVFATADTARLAGIVLPDSGHIQEEEAAYANRVRSSRHHPALPLYTQDEAGQSLEAFRPVAFDVESRLAGADVRFRPAGHILGSSSVEVRGSGVSVVFSGDLGRPNHPLLSPPSPLPAADVLVIESTYGGRRHGSIDVVRHKLAAAVRAAARTGGTLVVPAFAVDRTEMVLWELAQLIGAGEAPSLPVYVDSPMALRALEVYRAALVDGASDLRPGLAPDPFGALDLHEVPTTAGSKALAQHRYPSIIVSASGMATGGRVLHHLMRTLPDSRNAVLLVGFQAAGTRGRQLLDGARAVKMFGRYVPVRADVVDLTGLSSHADEDELVSWVTANDRTPEQVFIVHGEPDASDALRRRLSECAESVVVVPRHLEQVRIG